MALIILTIKKYCQGDIGVAKNRREAVHFFRLIEVLLEALPQAVLQLYIAAYKNRLDALVIVSIVTSLLSVALGITKVRVHFQGNI